MQEGSSGGSAPSAPFWLLDSLRSTIPLGHDPSGIGGWTDGVGGSNTTSPWFYWDPAVGGDHDKGTLVIGEFSGGANRSANEGLASVVWRDQYVLLLQNH